MKEILPNNFATLFKCILLFFKVRTKNKDGFLEIRKNRITIQNYIIEFDIEISDVRDDFQEDLINQTIATKLDELEVEFLNCSFSNNVIININEIKAISFKECTIGNFFNIEKSSSINRLSLSRCDFKGRFDLGGNISNIYINYSNFFGKTFFNDIVCAEDFVIKDSEFNNICKFYRSRFISPFTIKSSDFTTLFKREFEIDNSNEFYSSVEFFNIKCEFVFAFSFKSMPMTSNLVIAGFKDKSLIKNLVIRTMPPNTLINDVKIENLELSNQVLQR